MDNWVDKLIIEYEEGRKDLYELKNRLGVSELDKLDRTQINSMINDMAYSIEWMKRGRRPGNLRGVDKRSAYQRRVLLDMDLFPSWDIEPEQRKLTEKEKKVVYEVLLLLSHRERQCYLLHMAQGWTMQEIADELKITKSSVQKYVERAKKKISCHTNSIHALLGGEKSII